MKRHDWQLSAASDWAGYGGRKWWPSLFTCRFEVKTLRCSLQTCGVLHLRLVFFLFSASVWNDRRTLGVVMKPLSRRSGPNAPSVLGAPTLRPHARLTHTHTHTSPLPLCCCLLSSLLLTYCALLSLFSPPVPPHIPHPLSLITSSPHHSVLTSSACFFFFFPLILLLLLPRFYSQNIALLSQSQIRRAAGLRVTSLSLSFGDLTSTIASFCPSWSAYKHEFPAG